MSDHPATAAETLALPPSAPKVRITAGVGTSNQKTWVVRRPATLIGSGRQSHIVLAATEVTRAHCLLVNTGDAVLLKDLHSQIGTRRGDAEADLEALSDGDVVRVGETVLQVAIAAVEQDPEASMDGATYTDPLLLREPVEIRVAGESKSWTLKAGISVIGRSPRSTVHLEHPEVSLAHAAVFEVGRQVAIMDLDSRNGLSINGEPRTIALLQNGDQLRVGPYELSVSMRSAQRSSVGLHRAQAAGDARGSTCPEPADLEQRKARLDEQQRALEAAQLNLEKERAALQRQAAALRESEAALELRRRSLEQREKTLRETLLRQAQGVLAVSPFLAAAEPTLDSRIIAGPTN